MGSTHACCAQKERREPTTSRQPPSKRSQTMARPQTFVQTVDRNLHEIMLGLEVAASVLFAIGQFSVKNCSVTALWVSFANGRAPRCEIDLSNSWDANVVLHSLIAATLVALLFITTVRLFGVQRRQRRINSILRIKRDRGVLFVISSVPFGGHNTSESFKDYFTWTTPQDGVEGVRRLLPLLFEIGVKPEQISVKFSEKVNDEELIRSNLFLIGGHEHNSITERFNRDSIPVGDRRAGHPTPMQLDQNQIIQKGSAPLATELRDGVPVRDFGLVTRGVNHYTVKPDGSRPCAVWSFEGVRHWGTLSGIDVLAAITSKKCSKRLARQCPGISSSLEDAPLIQFVTQCSVDKEYDLNFDDQIVSVYPSEGGGP